MARFKDREKAIQLRLQGLSYSQIKGRIGVSKSTLSGWLHNYPLSQERINELRAWSEQRIERFRITMRKKREGRLWEVYNTQKEDLLPLSEKEFFIAGLLLYAGEGAKTRNSMVAISNTNPVIINFFISWLIRVCEINKEKIKIRLHLYRDMNENQEVRYWMKMTGLPKRHFRKSYIKDGSRERINYHGTFGHGTCNVIVHSVPLFEKIMMSIKVIFDSIVGA